MFSPDFLNKELCTATNIKDRSNRKLVQQLLKKLIESICGKIFINGIFCFVGITKDNEEILEFIEPIYLNDTFIYRCDSKFYTDGLTKYIQKRADREEMHLILVDGIEFLIYQWSGTSFTKMKHSNALLVKKHNKGGSSSKRFERIAEESRLHYSENIVDLINSMCRSSNCIWLFGAQDIKQRVLASKKLLVSSSLIHTKDMWFTFEKTDFISTHKKELELLFSSSLQNESKVDRCCAQVLELISKDPDWLCFGTDIDEKQCEYIIQIDDKSQTTSGKYIKCTMNNSYYAKLKNYEKIGKLYFKPINDQF